MKKNLRRVTMTVTAQTAYHLKNMADASGHRDMGRVVDKLVREHQLAGGLFEYGRANNDKQKGSKHHGIF